MSVSDIERITVLETNHSFMMKEVGEIKSDVKTILEKFEKLEGKFATKDSVKKLRVIVWSIIGFVFSVVGVALLSLIIVRN